MKERFNSHENDFTAQEEAAQKGTRFQKKNADKGRKKRFEAQTREGQKRTDRIIAGCRACFGNFFRYKRYSCTNGRYS